LDVDWRIFVELRYERSGFTIVIQIKAITIVNTKQSRGSYGV